MVLDDLLVKMGHTACWLSHAVGRRQASLGTPDSRTPTGYNCHMMNIIQQIADPMPMIFLRIDLAKLLLLLLLLSLLQNYCYHYYRYCCCYRYYQNYHIIVLLITFLQTINLQV